MTKKAWIVIVIVLVAAIVAGSVFFAVAAKNDSLPDDTENTQTAALKPIEYVEIVVDGYGTITAELYSEIAPITVANFLKLTDEGFYDGLTFHRIISGFMIQGGDPLGNGMGGSPEKIKGEFSANGVTNPIKHTRGVLSMARSKANDSASSQFFIMHADAPHLNGQYAAFGQVISGMEVVDAICQNTPVLDNNGTVAAANQPRITRITRIDAPAVVEETPDELTVERLTGEVYFSPDGAVISPASDDDWVYHFTYAYPRMTGNSSAAVSINQTFDEVLNDWLYLSLPMFANAPEMQFAQSNEVVHDFTVTCQNDRFLSFLLNRSQTKSEGVNLVLEGVVFDMTGEYQYDTLTLRGLVMVGESTDQIAEAVLPVLYGEFVKLQESGIARADVTEEEFAMDFSPAEHFYADAESNAVFFIPPMLLAEPTFDVPTFTFSPADLEALLNQYT